MTRVGSRKAHVLVVDDEQAARSELERLLLQQGYSVELAVDGASALARAAEVSPDVVVTDLKMPGMDGVELCRRLHALDAQLPVVVVTASGDVSSAVAAMRAGAEDYLLQPVDFEELALSVDRALQRRALRAEADNLRRQLHERAGLALEGLIGVSPAMHKVHRIAGQVAGAKATVLITGESGTGKGEIARAIHAKGPRASKPFVALHCAALSDSLLESELFGHEKGAFTGADRRRIGRFEAAHGGTLFLDEVGEISPSTQVKLLRVLQERAFERVGGNELVSVDVRLIAATNRDLSADVESGRFREDLYYRLAVVHIDMPPLRVRDGDVLLLAAHFLHRFARDNAKLLDGFSDAARAKLLAHRWPGNVRELENAIERAVVLCDGSTIEEEHLPIDVAPVSKGVLRVPGATMAEVERFTILATLEATNGSTARAADMLGVSVRTIQYRLREYGGRR